MDSEEKVGLVKNTAYDDGAYRGVRAQKKGHKTPPCARSVCEEAKK